MKVPVSNLKVEKSENLENTFYVFLMFFWHDTSKKRKKSRFLDFEKNVKNVLSNYGDKLLSQLNATVG